jgi:hypothetical protein
MYARPTAQIDRPRVGSAQEAADLVAHVIEALSGLSHVIGEETRLMQEGQIGQALEREGKKAELAGKYMRGLEVVKANAVALARLVPEDVKRLRAAHESFTDLLQTNQAVLATARAVSETIVRDLARDAGRTAQPQGYAVNGYGAVTTPQARPSAGPIAVSRKL